MLKTDMLQIYLADTDLEHEGGWWIGIARDHPLFSDDRSMAALFTPAQALRLIRHYGGQIVRQDEEP